MAKTKTKKSDAEVALPTGPRPRLSKMIVRNFRSIGPNPVTIDLDDIVVLVGPNNAGKSTILKAYEVIMSEGSKEGQLSIEDFPGGVVNPSALPEVELHSVVFDNGPGAEWIGQNSDGEMLVREMWKWTGPGDPVRRGFNVAENRWASEDDDEKVPWGAAGVANSRRPQPHRIDAFASPSDQAKAIIELLMEAIKERVKQYQSDAKADSQTDLGVLFGNIETLQKKIVAESESQISAVQEELSKFISAVFPGYRVKFDAKAEDDLDKALSLFKSSPRLLMGPDGGYLSDIGNQGSGARRTLLWAAVRLLAESGKKKSSGNRPHLLLLDEPEICLHPDAVREACDLLYSLPDLTMNWQVMVTTHSPTFVDFTRDHTTIVRVERNVDGCVSGTTIFRPSKASFDEDARTTLKLLNFCDPYIAEFFFGGKTIVVEGDTEYTALKYAISKLPQSERGIHVVRARGKGTIVLLCKILNQFGTPYSVLHDSDLPTYMKEGKEHENPAWNLNEKIREEMEQSQVQTRRIASLGNFEVAYLGKEVKNNKPYNALSSMMAESETFGTISGLLEALVDFSKPLPDGAAEWSDLASLKSIVADDVQEQ